MTEAEMRAILSAHLAQFRRWGYAQLAARIPSMGHLAQNEGTAADGTPYYLSFDVVWDDQKNGNIRVMGDICAEPRRTILGLIEIPNVVEDFIMAPDGRFIGEELG